GTNLGRSRPFALADGEVSFVGEPVAIVVAEDRYVAEDAAALVEVDYEVLAPAIDCRNERAPPVRRELASNRVISYTVGYGDIEAAFAKAAHIVPMPPRNATNTGRSSSPPTATGACAVCAAGSFTISAPMRCKT